MLTKDDYHYGAVEAVAINAYENGGLPKTFELGRGGYSMAWLEWADLPENGRDLVRQEVLRFFRALEAAGYKVVGPEPTEAMIAECQGNYDKHPMLKYLTPEERGNAPLFPLAHWRAHFAAAPTLTEKE